MRANATSFGCRSGAVPCRGAAWRTHRSLSIHAVSVCSLLLAATRRRHRSIHDIVCQLMYRPRRRPTPPFRPPAILIPTPWAHADGRSLQISVRHPSTIPNEDRPDVTHNQSVNQSQVNFRHKLRIKPYDTMRRTRSKADR